MVKPKIEGPWKSEKFEKVFMPGISIDTVIFGFHERRLMVLLLQYKNTKSFALPGGFIYKDEDLNQAALRTLKERTSLKNIYLEQFYTFGDIKRYDNSFELIMEGRGIKPPKNHFLLRRFISVGYYALVDFTKAIPATDELADACQWHDIDKIPKLIQDHKLIIKKAIQTLRDDLDKKLVGFDLMQENFTMNELQDLYETILGEKLLRTSFQRKMLNLGILQKVDKKWTGEAHKAPYLYRFKAK